MTSGIAPVTDQSASSVPITSTETPVPLFWVSVARLSLRSDCAWPGGSAQLPDQRVRRQGSPTSAKIPTAMVSTRGDRQKATAAMLVRWSSSGFLGRPPKNCRNTSRADSCAGVGSASFGSCPSGRGCGPCPSFSGATSSRRSCSRDRCSRSKRFIVAASHCA